MFGWFKKKEKRAASNLTYPQQWLIDALVGPRSASGERVGPNAALSVSAYFAAIRNISEDVGKLSIYVNKNMPGGGIEQTFNSLQVLLDQPNEEIDRMTFISTLVAHALGHGNGYAQIVRNNAGMPVKLHLMTPDRVNPRRRDNDNQLLYVVDGGELVLLPNQVIHLKNFSHDGVSGLSVAHQARETLGLAIASQKTAASLYANQAVPRGYFSTDQKMDDVDAGNFMKSWRENYGGTDNAGKTPLLEWGIKYNALQLNPEDAAFLAMMKFSVKEIARWFRIPAHKIGDLDQATFSNIDSQKIEYASDTIHPWVTRLELELSRKLVMTYGQQYGHFISFDMAELLRGDPVALASKRGTEVTHGLRSINEIRGEDGYAPVEGGEAPLVAVNLQTLANLKRKEDQTMELAAQAKAPPQAPPASPDETPTPAAEAPQGRSSGQEGLTAVKQAQAPLLAGVLRSIRNTEEDKARRGKPLPEDHVETVRTKIAPTIEAASSLMYFILTSTHMPEGKKERVQTLIHSIAEERNPTITPEDEALAMLNKLEALLLDMTQEKDGI